MRWLLVILEAPSQIGIVEDLLDVFLSTLFIGFVERDRDIEIREVVFLLVLGEVARASNKSSEACVDHLEGLSQNENLFVGNFLVLESLPQNPDDTILVQGLSPGVPIESRKGLFAY